MKRKPRIAAVVVVLLLGGLWFYRTHLAARLPRFPLAEGGEFRVVKICYGGPDDHKIGGAPAWLIRTWRRLPPPLQKIIPRPADGFREMTPLEGHVAVSIWWAFFDPETNGPEIGPSGDVIMTTDSGEDTNLEWAHPTELGYREIILTDPPTNSRKLHFMVPVEEETVEFTIANPAYGR